MEDLAIAVRRAFSFFVYRRSFAPVLCLFLAAGLFFAATHKARACASCPCVIANHIITRLIIEREHGYGVFVTDPESLAYVTASVCQPGLGTRGWIAYEFCRHREEFIVFYWFKEDVMAAMMMMTEQLVSNAMEQMLIIGAFFDASLQLETQRTFEELAAEAHRNFQPGTGMCEIGTLARSLGASQRLGEVNAHALGQHMQRRQMHNLSMGSSAGKGADIVHRWERFKKTFCNPSDNNAELGPRTTTPICTGTSLTGTSSPLDYDVDYTYMVEYPNTITVDFSDTDKNLKEESIFELASNLYGHDVFEYFPEAYFKNPRNQSAFMYMRSIVAKRSVAQNSFNNIVALKTQGKEESEESLTYMSRVLEQLGIEDETQRLQILGGTVDAGSEAGKRPSYYAQMELLAKRLYQRPEFYTNLYDKTANVERTKAAMKAIDLIQTMDLFKSKLRSEAALAVLTGIEIDRAQQHVQDLMNESKDSGVESK